MTIYLFDESRLLVDLLQQRLSKVTPGQWNDTVRQSAYRFRDKRRFRSKNFKKFYQHLTSLLRILYLYSISVYAFGLKN